MIHVPFLYKTVCLSLFCRLWHSNFSINCFFCFICSSSFFLLCFKSTKNKTNNPIYFSQVCPVFCVLLFFLFFLSLDYSSLQSYNSFIVLHSFLFSFNFFGFVIFLILVIFLHIPLVFLYALHHFHGLSLLVVLLTLSRRNIYLVFLRTLLLVLIFYYL